MYNIAFTGRTKKEVHQDEADSSKADDQEEKINEHPKTLSNDKINKT